VPEQQGQGQGNDSRAKPQVQVAAGLQCVGWPVAWVLSALYVGTPDVSIPHVGTLHVGARPLRAVSLIARPEPPVFSLALGQILDPQSW